MTFSAEFTPNSKSELLKSTSHLAIASAEVKDYTHTISQLVEDIIASSERNDLKQAA